AQATSAVVAGDIDGASTTLGSTYKASGSGLEVVLYEAVGMGTGNLANNPWIQELPDPITKACWDNFACLAKATAADLGVEQGDVVKIDLKGKSVDLPVIIQPGQAL